MSAQIDFTPALSSAYSKQIEARGPTDAEIEWQALQVLRGLTPADASDALYDSMEQIRLAVMQGIEPRCIGQIVQAAIHDYCTRVALRMLEVE